MGLGWLTPLFFVPIALFAAVGYACMRSRSTKRTGWSSTLIHRRVTIAGESFTDGEILVILCYFVFFL
jgi:hypothetical protein